MGWYTELEEFKMLNIRIERSGDTAVLHCDGQILVGNSLSALRDAVLCEMDKRSIVLDLSCVKRIDAGGLGMLVFLHTCTHGLGTELKLGRPSVQVAEMLELTNLSSVFTIGPAAEAAAGPVSSLPDLLCPACA
ncbi:MAG TPA: STAS domain-containing protein [Terriglobales bacterium]|nr:STAS domain-containing protein [Terriglobales bacterium]